MSENKETLELVTLKNNGSNDTDDEMYAADSDETVWTKNAFGDARLIFALIPPPIIVGGLIVNLIVLVMTARRDCFHRHPVGVYVSSLCVCFAGLLLVDSGLQEWASFVTGGPITGRAPWLCRGVPFAVGWVRTSACWLTVCALIDRCVAIITSLQLGNPPSSEAPGNQLTASTSKQDKEPATSAGEIALQVPTGTEVSAPTNLVEGKHKQETGTSADEEARSTMGRRRPLFCRPVVVMLLTAGVFVAMAFANSPLLIRRWIRHQHVDVEPSCKVPYRMVKLCGIAYYGTTATPLVVGVLLFLAVLLLVVVSAFRGHVPDAEDTAMVLVISCPVSVCLFIVELLRVLCDYEVVDDLGGVVQELSDLVFYAVVALVPALCFAVAPSLRCGGQPSDKTDVPAAVSDEAVRLSATADGQETADAQ